MEEKSNLKSKKFNQKSYLYGMYKNKFYPVINFEELLNFEEELRRFKPSLEIDEVEDELIRSDITDAKDILFELLKKEIKEQK